MKGVQNREASRTSSCEHTEQGALRARGRGQGAADVGLGRADLVMRVKFPGGDTILLVEVKASGEPRLAREAVNQLLQYKGTVADSYAVFSGPVYPPPRQRRCAEKQALATWIWQAIASWPLEGCTLKGREIPIPGGERGLRILYSQSDASAAGLAGKPAQAVEAAGPGGAVAGEHRTGAQSEKHPGGPEWVRQNRVGYR